MRELGPGRQTVRFAVPSEVCAQMKQADTPVDGKGILNWCIRNSISHVASGLSLWASQGLHFHKVSPLVESQPEIACEDISLGLEVMYRDPIVRVPIEKSVKAEREYCMSRAGLELSESTMHSVDGIIHRVERLGAGFSTSSTTGVGEECEREIENENELEEEIAEEIPTAIPCEERDWAYSEVLQTERVSDILEACGAISLFSFIAQSMGATEFAEKDFQNVYATRNFCQTVEHSAAGSKEMEGFLRTVDVCIVFSCRGVLLVSEREADCILALVWDSCKFGMCTRSSEKLPMFVNLRYLSQSEAGDNVALCLKSKSEFQGTNNCTDETLASLQIFNGDTNFRGFDGSLLLDRLNAVRRLAIASLQSEVRGEDKSADVLRFAIARGRSIQIDGSDLQRLLDNE